MKQALLRADNRANAAPNQNTPEFSQAAATSHSTQFISNDAGTLLLDSKGTVQFCSVAAARLFGAAPDELTGRQIRTLIPGLPFNPLTEGYNVAFAAFASPLRRARMWQCVTGEGRAVQVEAKITLLRISGVYLFNLELCVADSAACEEQPFFPLPISPVEKIVGLRPAKPTSPQRTAVCHGGTIGPVARIAYF